MGHSKLACAIVKINDFIGSDNFKVFCFFEGLIQLFVFILCDAPPDNPQRILDLWLYHHYLHSFIFVHILVIFASIFGFLFLIYIPFKYDQMIEWAKRNC